MHFAGLAPDVVIYDYLKSTGQLTPALEKLLKDYARSGVQNELGYAHTDYSFSAFGNSDASGSSWLTAFVVRVFIKARIMVTIDENVITRALKWLAGRQVSNFTYWLHSPSTLFLFPLSKRMVNSTNLVTSATRICRVKLRRVWH